MSDVDRLAERRLAADERTRRRGLTLGAAWREFWRHPSPWLIGSFLLAAVVGRAVVGGGARGGCDVKLYRINKVDAPGGRTLKKKDVLARDDAEAIKRAADSEDCPVCEVLRDGNPIGLIA